MMGAVSADMAARTSSINRLVQFTQALSDPLRVQILALLLGGKSSCCCAESDTPSLGVCVCEITEHMDLAQSKVSYHLAKLKKAGLITETRCGKWNYYTVNQYVIQEYLKTCSEFLTGEAIK